MIMVKVSYDPLISNRDFPRKSGRKRRLCLLSGGRTNPQAPADCRNVLFHTLVQGLGFRIQVSGFSVEGVGLRVEG